MPGTVVITGANGNLGTEVVRHFLANEYRVIAIDGKDDHLADAHAHSNFRFISANLLDEAAVAELLADLGKNESVTAGFFLAGGFAMGSFEETTPADMRKMIDLNFFTAYTISQGLYASMKRAGYGRLVYVGARPALEPSAGKSMTAYSISKSMLFRLAEQINAASKDVDVTASVIVPSTIDTPPNRASMPDADFSKWVTPAEIAELLLVIVSGAGAKLKEGVFKF